MALLFAVSGFCEGLRDRVTASCCWESWPMGTEHMPLALTAASATTFSFACCVHRVCPFKNINKRVLGDEASRERTCCYLRRTLRTLELDQHQLTLGGIIQMSLPMRNVLLLPPALAALSSLAAVIARLAKAGWKTPWKI